MNKRLYPAYCLTAAILAAGTLILGGCSSEQAVQPVKPAVSVPSILNTAWRVVELNGAKTGFLSGQKLDFYLTLSRGGQFSGSTGCNHLSGSYIMNAGRLSFGSLLITRIACPSPLMERERMFLDAIRKVVSYSNEDGRLRLFSADGQKIIELSAVRKF
ncbi:MAG: META domain-containing protein [Chlorobiaceae bacterium]|nr:META domain-containing protein [Chlorobiaceae bacterium]